MMVEPAHISDGERWAIVELAIDYALGAHQKRGEIKGWKHNYKVSGRGGVNLVLFGCRAERVLVPVPDFNSVNNIWSYVHELLDYRITGYARGVNEFSDKWRKRIYESLPDDVMMVSEEEWNARSKHEKVVKEVSEKIWKSVQERMAQDKEPVQP